MGTGRSLAKDFHNLQKNIRGLSGGQARVSDWDDENLSMFEVEIAPNDGLYKYAKFKFQFVVDMENYPDAGPPIIICLTDIYHPNIDTSGLQESSNICVSLQNEWTADNGLDDCIQALLFLFYNPNLADPLFPAIEPEITVEEFEDNVKLSLEGGDIDDMSFETNYGYLENGIKIENKIIMEKETGDLKIETNEEVNRESLAELNVETIDRLDRETSDELNTEVVEKLKIESIEKLNVETMGVNPSLQSFDIRKESEIADETKTEIISKYLDLDVSKETMASCDNERTKGSLAIKTEKHRHENRANLDNFVTK